jgi:Kef-type K+ transport system membrane component KefB
MLDSVHFTHFDEPHYIAEFKDAVLSSDPETQQRVISISEKQNEKHIEHILEPIGQFLSPIFFVMTGLAVDFTVFMNANTILTACILFIIAVIGKIASGLVAGKGVNRWIVGWGMVPRGEVGLIFASVGRVLGVVDAAEYTVIVVVIMLTTFITPPVLSYLLKKNSIS